MSARFETSTCRNCLGSGCVHCNHKGYFSRRIRRRDPEIEALRRKLLSIPSNIVALPRQPQEAA
jgi:hypothetical protein